MNEKETASMCQIDLNEDPPNPVKQPLEEKATVLPPLVTLERTDGQMHTIHNPQDELAFDVDEIAKEAQTQRQEVEVILIRLRTAVKGAFLEDANATVVCISTGFMWSYAQPGPWSNQWRMEVLEMVVKRLRAVQKGTWMVWIKREPTSELVCFSKKQPGKSA